MFIMIQKCSLWRVLGVFFSEPLKIHYIKEISRKITLAPTSVKKHLSHLSKQNLILKTKGERFFGFMANRDSGEFIFYKRMDNMIKIKESGLLDFLINSIYPEAMVLFGSYFRGEDVETSDIDIFMLTKAKKALSVEKFEPFLNRHVHIIMESSLKDVRPELRTDISNGIVLYGYLK